VPTSRRSHPPAKKAEQARAATAHGPTVNRAGQSRGDSTRPPWLGPPESLLLPLLKGERGPTPGELAFTVFLKAAEHYEDGSRLGPKIRPKLAVIEEELNGYGISLIELFPWPSIMWERQTLVEWKALPILRGRRPKHDLTRDINRLRALLDSEHIHSDVKILLAAESGRLERLILRGPSALRAVPAPLVFPKVLTGELTDRNIEAFLKRIERWTPGYSLPGWTELVRGVHRDLSDHIANRPRATRLLAQILPLLFPQWWGPQGSRDRLQALIRYKRRRQGKEPSS
jgi:hypothetical protein